VSDALRIGRHALGPLELSVLELLWDRGLPLTVRDVRGEFPALAYTTVMTTLDRLFRKRLLVRHQRGRAFIYDTCCSRDELLGRLLSGRLTDLLGGGSGTATAVLSTLVRAVSSKDVALLDELDALVRAESARLNLEEK
jgi:predicted transcriptional regulator